MSLSPREVIVGAGAGVVLVGTAILLVKGIEKIAEAIRGCRGEEEQVEGMVVGIVQTGEAAAGEAAGPAGAGEAAGPAGPAAGPTAGVAAAA